MFPPAYTLTILVLTLLQFSFDKNFKSVCEKNLNNQTSDTSSCLNNQNRREIRQLTDSELEFFISKYNDYLVRNNTQQWNEDISELGVVQIFDELLGDRLLTPYWDYRIELNLSDPTWSSIWNDSKFADVSEAVDAQWLAEIINSDVQEDSNDFFDDPNIGLWKRRERALNVMRTVKGNDVFWHLLVLVSIEAGVDQQNLTITKSSCNSYEGLYWNNTHCVPYLRDGAYCKIKRECHSNLCLDNYCGNITITITSTTSTPITTTVISAVETTQNHILENVTNLAEVSQRHFPWLTTEFLAKELTPPKQMKNKFKAERKPKKHKKKKKKQKETSTVAPTEPAFNEQIPPTTLQTEPTISMVMPSDAVNETNAPIEPEKYSEDTLDALLVYMPKPKEPAGMIPWTNRMPFKMAYFSFTVIEGSLGKNRKLKEKGTKRAKGARIYVKGLEMPSGYKQITQGKQLRSGIGSLARTLHPDNNGPFVEFKMRVENRYGIACKQMCLDAHHRYRRCARKTIRISPYKRFGDPIPYYESEQRAIEGQFTGKGYYKKRKLTHILFKCE